jgi:hypothetical protein
MMSKNQFHNYSSHKNSSVAPQKIHIPGVYKLPNLLVGAGGGEEKKTPHFRKARTGADLLNSYYWGLLINSMSNI